jgi:hypothetical protein
VNVNGNDDDDDQGQGSDALETSLRDDLATAISDIQARETAAAAGDGGGTSTADTSAPADDAKPARTDGRDATGRFAGKAAKTDAAETTATDAAPAAAATTDAAASDADAPPKSWRQDEAAEWAGLSPKARAAIQRREREIATMAGRQDGERLFGKEMADIVRPYADEIAAAGATPQLALQTMLTNHQLLRSNDPAKKISTARRLMVEYGIDPRMLAAPDPNMPQDPHVLNLQRQVEQLTARLTQQGQGGQQQNYAPLPGTGDDDNVSTDIEAFRADPAHPHFEQVAGHMASLIESGAAPDLESAYQMAVQANPALRSTLPAPAAQDAQRSDKVAAARRAGVSVEGSPGVTGAPKPATLRDELRENLRAVGIG